MKNVLVTATTFPRWKNDTEPSFVYVLSNLLAKKGYKVAVLAPHHYKAKKFEIMENLKVYRFPYFYPLRLQKLCYDGGVLENIKKSLLAKLQVPLLLISEFFYLRKIIKRENIDFIHAHWIVPQGFLAAIARRLYNIPFIATAHAGDVFPLRTKSTKSFARFALESSSFITANSTFTRKALSEILSKDVKVIPMGVDLSRFSPNKKDNSLKKKLGIENRLILFVGRLAEKKGIEHLIRAMPAALKKLPNSRLAIIGDGPEREKLASLTKDLNLQKDVLFLGKIRNEDLPEYYATADVFVAPSIVAKSGDTEGLGVVLLEAIASGTCVIGSNVGGIPDIIRHNRTGLLVEEKNSSQLADSIANLLKNSRLQKKLRKNAMAHVRKEYSWGKVAKRFAELYAKMK